MKTLKGWENSEKDLDEYLTHEPCKINESLFRYICEQVPCAYAHHSKERNLVQGLDPIDTIEEDGYGIATYITVTEIGEKFFYLGILPEFLE